MVAVLITATMSLLGLGAVSGSAVAGASVAPTPRAPVVHHPLISVAHQGTSLNVSQSNNWSGYGQGILDTKQLVTSISGTWTVPTATQHTAGQAENSATWIGIGGGCLNSSCAATDSTLVQAGTEQDVAADGTASYAAWWEIVPVPSITASITVHPGDVIHCVISQTLPEVWSISLSDLTDGQSFSQTVPYPSDYSTAEWIEETPVVVGTSGTGVAALPNLSTVSFSNATVNGANAGLVPAQAIQLASSSGQVLATPSAPGSTTDDFNDCSYATSCPAP